MPTAPIETAQAGPPRNVVKMAVVEPPLCVLKLTFSGPLVFLFIVALVSFGITCGDIEVTLLGVPSALTT